MKTVIIGGGVAGLTAGIYGQLLGMDCTIIEKNAFLGGNMTAWKRNGYPIDNCIHWLTGTKKGTSLNRMWNTVGMLDRKVQLCRNEEFYRSELRGNSIALSRDPDKTLSDMIALSPSDSKESENFIKRVKRIAAAPDECIKEKLAYVLPVIKYGKMSLKDLSDRFSHPLLKNLMVDYLSPELSALALICAYATFTAGNGDVPYGGSRDAAERMKKRYLKLGGKIMLSEAAVRIVLNKKTGKAKGVITERENFIPADNIICTCDPNVTFGRLLPEEYMPKTMKRAYKSSESMPLFSAVHAAFVCDSSKELPNVPTIFESAGIKTGKRTVKRILIKPYTSAELNIFKGKTVLQVMLYLYDSESKIWCSASKNAKKYKEMKENFAKAVEKAVSKRYPSVKDSIEILDVWTPATYNKYFDAKHGAFLSFASKPGKALLYRVPTRINGLDNVFLATQWQSSPGGLPIAAKKGKKAAYLVAKMNKKHL